MAKSKINLDKLSLKELHELQKKAEKAIEEKKRTALKTVRQEVKKLIKDHGYTPEDIFPALKSAKKTTNKIAPKYQNPDNPDQTWTGRGRKPKWAAEYMEKGDLESIEIK